MNVSELQRKLKNLNPEAEVFIDHEGLVELGAVYIEPHGEKINIDNKDGTVKYKYVVKLREF